MNEETIKKMSELKEEWGLERYVLALGKATGFLLEHRHPIAAREIELLKDDSEDAFEVFSSYTLHGLD